MCDGYLIVLNCILVDLVTRMYASEVQEMSFLCLFFLEGAMIGKKATLIFEHLLIAKGFRYYLEPGETDIILQLKN